MNPRRIEYVASLALVLCLLWGASVLGAVQSHLSEPYPDDQYNLEVGVSAGLPAVGNFVLGYWGGPMVFRASGGYWGLNSYYGFQGDAGWAFSREGALKQYVCGSAAQIAGKNRHGTQATLLGVEYGLNFHGASLEVGPEWNLGQFNGVKSGRKLGVFFQVGYSFFIPSY